MEQDVIALTGEQDLAGDKPIEVLELAVFIARLFAQSRTFHYELLQVRLMHVPDRELVLTKSNGSNEALGAGYPLHLLKRVLSPDWTQHLLRLLLGHLPHFNHFILATSQEHVPLSRVPVETLHTFQVSDELNDRFLAAPGVPNTDFTVLVTASQVVLVARAILDALNSLHLVVRAVSIVTHLHQVPVHVDVEHLDGLVVAPRDELVRIQQRPVEVGLSLVLVALLELASLHVVQLHCPVVSRVQDFVSKHFVPADLPRRLV